MTFWDKRARELAARHEHPTPRHEPPTKLELSMLQLGRAMADARAEEIARQIESRGSCCNGITPGHFVDNCARIALSTITKPKTREQVLEEALREAPKRMREHARIALKCGNGEQATAYESAAIDLEGSSRSALEWKP